MSHLLCDINNMYSRNFSKKPSFGGRFSRGTGAGPRFGNRRFGASGGGFRGKGGRGGMRGGENINISKFICKAEITEKAECFVPEHKFIDFNVSDALKANIIKKGYTIPTPIQDKIIPHILRGSDVVGIANTGTGKTGAFAIPLIQKVLLNPKNNILIVVPTRELAVQINTEIREFSSGMKIFSVCVVGGSSMGHQISELRYHNNFIIGTPGRLKDLIERKYINLAEFSTIVLDEADRMLDMGFIHDVKFMMAKMPKEKHTLFFSATISKEIETLIKEFLREPVTISVKTGDTAKNVDQDIIRIQKESPKIDTLHNLLIKPEFSKVLIFGQTKHGVEKLSKVLVERGFKAEAIHGNKSQSQRQRALSLFKESKVKILVATDVAARGLDIPNVSHVINFDIPNTYDDYVHRIGRTGRGDKKGIALTFV